MEPQVQQSNDAPPPEAASRRRFWRKAKSDKPNSDSEVKNKYPPVPYLHLFRYANKVDKLLILGSVIFAVAHGSLLPILIITFGSTLDDFGNILRDPSDPEYVPVEDISDEISSTTNLVLILSFVVFILSIFQLALALAAANRIGNDLRRRFFDNLIRQDCDFYDDSEAGALTNIVVNDINLIQGGVGDKLATCVQYFATFVIGVVIGFVYGWKLALVIFAVTPLILATGAVFGNASAEATGEGLGSYGEANSVASEVLSLLRTVTAFGGQEEEIKRYDTAVERGYRSAAKAAVVSGIGIGLAMMFILLTYPLAFWAGARFVRDNSMSAGDVLLTFLAFAIGASSLGTAGPAFKSFGAARAAAPRVFEIIERNSLIDPLDADTGLVPRDPVHGRITFESVDFNYRKRINEQGQSALVLEKLNLDIPPGSSEAFVGKSGCGKSTIARLILRLYDPLNGRVLLDGVDLSDLNVRWLRSQIGIVPQTPALFRLSIRDNIALGAGAVITQDEKTGKVLATSREVSGDEIIAAAKLANAHGFISKLPEGYDTLLGERGAMLSGGQKQRVCIARALVRNPKILLLDESTASLDTASERIVQDALEKAAAGRTTITIAHRLSTVKNADAISCIQDGIVVERGKHGDLIDKPNGFYHNLFELQNIEKERFEKEKEDLAEEDAEPVEPTPQKSSVAQISQSKGVSESITKPTEMMAIEEEEGPAVDKGIFRRSLKLNKDEWLLLILGPLGSLLAGAVLPLMSIPFIQVLLVMLTNNTDAALRKWLVGFVILAVLAFFGNALQNGVLGVAGERLTKKLRQMAFRSLLRQEIGFFDMEENSIGAMTGLLSTECGAVKGLTGDLFGIMLSVVGAIATGLIIGFVSCWRLSLVMLAIIPGVGLGGYFEMQAVSGIDSGSRKGFAKANEIATEAVDNVATVRHLGVEKHFVQQYQDKIRATVAAKRKRSLLTGVAYGFSEFCQFMIWYATYKAGGNFVAQGHCTFPDMYRTTLALMFAAITLGNVTVFAPDLGASRVGATHVYRLIDRNSEIDPTSSEGEVLNDADGGVSAEKVRFEYPRRPDVHVLRGLSLNVDQGKTLAIVGTSGHGKSTIIALLERFYSIRSGRISIGEMDISLANVWSLRRHIGYVPQEPELFNRSIFDNIAYGAPHEAGTPITMEDVIAVAKEANAHEFIERLPQGYDTFVGARGEAISGGQRQRVAIARSLLRRPSLLLLDEATSALDAASEKLVQEALDRAASGRTTVLVAHRLSTIRNADIIAVIWRGRVAELGTHDDLLRKNGRYAELIESQLTQTT